MTRSRKIHYRLSRRRKPDDTSHLVKLADYAKTMDVSSTTIRNWIAGRKLVGYKYGGRWWIDPNSLFREPMYWTKKTPD